MLERKQKKTGAIMVICNTLTIIGGSLGSIVAYLVSGRKFNKDGLGQLINAVIWLSLQVILILAVLVPTGNIAEGWYHRLIESHKFVVIYAIAINVITFIVFVVDKIKAMSGRRRIREIILFALAFIGGALGGIMAMQIANHKVSKSYFATGIPMMFAIHIIVIACFGFGIF